MKSLSHTEGVALRRGRLARNKSVRSIWIASTLLVAGVLIGVGWGFAYNSKLQQKVSQKETEIEALREEVLVQVDDLSVQVEDLKARASRIDALGQRLTRIGDLDEDLEGFHAVVGVGGPDLADSGTPGGLLDSLGEMGLEVNTSARRLFETESVLLQWQQHLSFIPSGKPIEGRLTSRYGYRSDPFHRGKRFHSGVDFKARTGDRVNAVASGTVVYSGYRPGYGYTVDVDHGNGYLTRYAHNSRLVKKVGDQVRAGEEVAKAGSTGRSTGPHVHFEVWRDGKTVNPGKFITRPAVYRG